MSTHQGWSNTNYQMICTALSDYSENLNMEYIFGLNRYIETHSSGHCLNVPKALSTAQRKGYLYGDPIPFIGGAGSYASVIDGWPPSESRDSKKPGPLQEFLNARAGDYTLHCNLHKRRLGAL